MRNNILRVVLLGAIACYTLVVNSFNVGKLSISKDFQDMDTIHVLTESDSLFMRGKFLYNKKEYAAAIGFFGKSDSVIKVHYGTDCPYYGYGEKWTACCYHKLGMDSIALEYSIYYDKQPIDKLLTHSSDSVIWIALRLLDLGEIKNAAEKLSEAALLEKKELGPNSYWYANTLSVCSGLYSEIGQFGKAIDLGKEAVEIYKATFGIEHLNYSGCLNNLATIYDDCGNYLIAISLYKEALEIKERILGTEHPDYATDLSNLANSYLASGNYSEAVLTGRNAMEIRKKIFGSEHPDYAISLINLSYSYSVIGNYPEALRLATEAMEIWKKVYGINNSYYATSLHYLSQYYAQAGNYNKALQLGTEALEIRKKLLGPEDPHYVTSLVNLAVYNSHLGDLEEAIRIGKEAFVIGEKIFGKDHPNYATTLDILSCFYLKSGNYTEALNFAKKAMETMKRVYGAEHLKYAFSLKDLSSIYSHMGNYTEAYNYLKQFIDSSHSYILENFVVLSSDFRELLWTRKIGFYYNIIFPSIVEKNKNKESISELYDKTCLFAKSILLNTATEMRNIIFESGDSALVSKYNKLLSNISIYNKLIETPIKKRFMNIDSLKNVIRQQEMELAKKSMVYGNYTHNLTINWKDVQRRLDDNDIAVEFLDFPIHNTDSTMYVALTLKKEYECPHMVMLFERNQIKTIPDNSYYTTTCLFDLIWKPLEEELKDVNNIYFSPSGELHRIGIEYLPMGNEEKICDKYTLHRLSSTRQLELVQDDTKGEQNIIYGGLDYDAELDSTIVGITHVSTISQEIPRFFRANVDSLTLRASYDYLEGTKKEADQIAAGMESRHISYLYLCGKKGSEESFKKLNGTKPKLIHIATHGFYMTEDEAAKSKIAKSQMVTIGEDNLREFRLMEDKYMSRSGLLFSGCNRTINNETIPDGAEDGILTAQEISTLDLRGLDLTVLSACQTGLGDISSGEGVFGLQRGFKKAGAKTIIMSLWKVNDESTMKLMTNFYRHYLDGMSKEEAFHIAQDELRKECPSQQVRPDWASFIMLDGLN